MNAPLTIGTAAGFAGAEPASLEEVLSLAEGAAVFFGVDRDLNRQVGACASGAARFVRRSSARLAPWSRSRLARRVYDIGLIEGADHEITSTLFDLAGGLAQRGHLPLAVGCDHSFSYWLAASLLRVKRPLVYVYFDAHLDLGLHTDTADPRVTNGNFVAHLLRLPGVRCVNVGARAWSTYGPGYDAVSGLRIIRDSADTWRELEREVREQQVYLSVDVDVLDPSFVPNTGSVEPFGWTPERLRLLLSRVGQVCQVVGADVSELQAADGLGHTAEVAMRCLSALIGENES